jgi:tetrahydromethanopterin S-methyltransferase subunit B
MTSSETVAFSSVHGDPVPAESRPIPEKVQMSFGSVPNLFAALSNRPTLLEEYPVPDAVHSSAHPVVLEGRVPE